MELISSLAIIVFAALIHASFQLSVSMLTLLSGHALGAKKSHTKLLRLIASFLIGAAVMTLLLVSFTTYIFGSFFRSHPPFIAWYLVCGLLVSLGVAIWVFYYRRGTGTALWVPRGLASYLSDRTKATKRSAEAFSLGLTSVFGEILFIVAPVCITALVVIHLPVAWQLVGVGLYTAVSLLSLLIVSALIGSGHALSGIQRWREQNKRFLQFAAGGGLLVLSFYVYVDQVSAVTATAAAVGVLH